MRKPVAVLLAFLCSTAAQAQQEIRFWHAMGGALGQELAALVQRFNESQKETRVVAEQRGGYEDVMIAANSDQPLMVSSAASISRQAETSSLSAIGSSMRPSLDCWPQERAR